MPNWKKLITSGSDASLASLVVSNAVSASAFSGSFIGDGSGLTGLGTGAGIFRTTGSIEATTNDLQVTGSLDVGGTDSGAQLIVNRAGNGSLVSYQRSGVQQGFLSVHSSNEESLSLYATRHLFLASDNGGGAAATIELTDSNTVEVTGNTSITGNLVLGASGAATYGLNVYGTAEQSALIQTTGADSSPRLRLINDARHWQFIVDGADADQLKLRDSTAGAYRWAVDSSGNHNFQSGNITTTGTGAFGDTVSIDGVSSVLNVSGNGTNGSTAAAINLLENISSQPFGAANQFGFQWLLDGSTNKLLLRSGNGATVNTRLSLERDSGNFDFQSGNITTTGTFSSGAATVTDLVINTPGSAQALEIFRGTDLQYRVYADANGSVLGMGDNADMVQIDARTGQHSYFNQTVHIGGTSAPAGALEVTGNTSITGTLTASGQVTVTSGNAVLQDGRFESDQGAGGTDTHFRATRDSSTVWQLQTLSSDQFNLEVGGSDVFTATSSGASITGALDVSSTITQTGGSGFKVSANKPQVAIGGANGSWGGNYSTLKMYGSSTTEGGSVWMTSSDDSVEGAVFLSSGLYVRTSTSHPIYFLTGGTTALTLDSSQNATFAGIGHFRYNTSSPLSIGREGQPQTSGTSTYLAFTGQASGTGTHYAAGSIGARAEGTWTTTSSTRDASIVLRPVLGGSEFDGLVISSAGNATFSGNVTVPYGAQLYVNGTSTYSTNYFEGGTNSLALKRQGGTSLQSWNFSNLSTTFAGDVTLTTGDLTIGGSLVVLGDTIEAQVTELNIEDKIITIASGSVNGAASDGAGFIIDRGSDTHVSMSWDNTNSQFEINAGLSAGATTATSLKSSGGSFYGPDATRFMEVQSGHIADAIQVKPSTTEINASGAVRLKEAGTTILEIDGGNATLSGDLKFNIGATNGIIFDNLDNLNVPGIEWRNADSSRTLTVGLLTESTGTFGRKDLVVYTKGTADWTTAATETARFTQDGNTILAGDVTVAQAADGGSITIRSNQNDAAHSTTTPFGSFLVYSNDDSGVGAGVRGGIRVFPSSTTGAGGIVSLRSGGDVEALNLDNNQNATFAGDLTLSSGDLTVKGSSDFGGLQQNQASGGHIHRFSGASIQAPDTNYFGTYGTLLLHSTTAYTSSARRYLITNAYQTNKFAIIRSVDALTDPALGQQGAVSSGTADLVIDNAGNATFAGDLTLSSGDLRVNGRIALNHPLKTWGGDYESAIQGNTFSFYGHDTNTATYMASNLYRNGSNSLAYLSSGISAAQFTIYNGDFFWATVPPGTEDATATATQVMKLTEEGDLTLSAGNLSVSNNTNSDTIASVIASNAHGTLFLGASGSGKDTHIVYGNGRDLKFSYSASATATATGTEVLRLGGNGVAYFAGDLRIGTTSATSHGAESFRVVTDALEIANFHRNDSGAVKIQFTNSTTGTALGDGFFVGIDSDETASLQNREATAMTFRTSNVERFRVASDAYALGIGTTDIESWHSNWAAIQFGGGSIFGEAGGTSGTIQLLDNAYYDGAWKYVNSDEAARLNMPGDGRFSFETAASGTADAAITWSTKMYLTNDGMLLVGDTANANMTVGLTINQGANDDEILAFKSSDVAHGLTSQAETDTYAYFRKEDTTRGGLRITSIQEAGGVGSFGVTAFGDSSTTATANSIGLHDFYGSKHDGAGSESALDADQIVFSIRGNQGGSTKSLFLVDEDGDYFYNGADGGAFDVYEDAHLVRAFANATSKETVRTAHDDWVQYNEQTLVDIGVLGAPVSEGGLINGAQLQRVHTGAIWQNYMAISDTKTEVEVLRDRLADTESRLAIAESKLKQLPQA